MPATSEPRRNAATPPSESKSIFTRLAIRSALRPVKIHDNAPLRSAGKVRIVVPHAHVTDRVPFKIVEYNPDIRALARIIDRRDHLHAPVYHDVGCLVWI